MMRLMGAMEIFTAQQQEDIKDEVCMRGTLKAHRGTELSGSRCLKCKPLLGHGH